VLTASEAVKYIDAVGYCMLFPVTNVPLPSLYFAATRRNPHEKMIWDKFSAMVWNLKDELPRCRRAFYGKYFRGRGTLISLRLLPHFLAMRESAATPGDHERFYSEGRITEDARIIWKALAEHGPLATLELRHACKMESKAGNKRFKRAILDLQRLLIAVHSGAEQETAAWASGRYDLTCRAFPQETSASLRIPPEDARRALAGNYRKLYPQAAPAQLARFFGWTKDEAAAALASTLQEKSKSKAAGA
jgi:winged helix DNA-binding protein